jgi:hypothetical protein
MLVEEFVKVAAKDDEVEKLRKKVYKEVKQNPWKNIVPMALATGGIGAGATVGAQHAIKHFGQQNLPESVPEAVVPQDTIPSAATGGFKQFGQNAVSAVRQNPVPAIAGLAGAAVGTGLGALTSMSNNKYLRENVINKLSEQDLQYIAQNNLTAEEIKDYAFQKAKQQQLKMAADNSLTPEQRMLYEQLKPSYKKTLATALAAATTGGAVGGLTGGVLIGQEIPKNTGKGALVGLTAAVPASGIIQAQMNKKLKKVISELSPQELQQLQSMPEDKQLEYLTLANAQKYF